MVRTSKLTRRASTNEYSIAHLRDVKSPEIHPIIIGAHSRVHDTVRIRPGCAISAYSTVDAECELENSVGAYVHLNTHCRLGRGARLGYLISEYAKDPPADTKATIVVGANSQIGTAARIYPNTILMDSVQVGNGAEIGMLSMQKIKEFTTTEIDRACQIGKGAVIMSGVKLAEQIEVEPYTIIPSALSHHFIDQRNITITPKMIQEMLPKKHPAKYTYLDQVKARQKAVG